MRKGETVIFTSVDIGSTVTPDPISVLLKDGQVLGVQQVGAHAHIVYSHMPEAAEVSIQVQVLQDGQPAPVGVHLGQFVVAGVILHVFELTAQPGGAE